MRKALTASKTSLGLSSAYIAIAKGLILYLDHNHLLDDPIFELDNKGTFSKAIDRLCSKAHMAYMGLREQFNLYNGTSVEVMIKLFNTTVQPIRHMDVNYGAYSAGGKMKPNV